MAYDNVINDDIEEDFIWRRPTKRTRGITFNTSSRTGIWGKALKWGTMALIGAAALGITAKAGRAALNMWSTTCPARVPTKGGTRAHRARGYLNGSLDRARTLAAGAGELFNAVFVLPPPGQAREYRNGAPFPGNEQEGPAPFVPLLPQLSWLRGPDDQVTETMPVIPLPDMRRMLDYVPSSVIETLNMGQLHPTGLRDTREKDIHLERGSQ
ncbi:putative rRNA processing protein [Neospora caninum Liverpool]|uniref:Putative rRNA processing protein n=1 Tax=Neospora caninum (strain Liverpool) TaxID=572307 RepID=F0VM48_NEOCL|nr:putative rRNA processing protein [Neospora caninum Liverpool]CBZ54326.1 putative rRNA processing protein [Neospora caninum Liverpool]CEL69031.1 TPA: rRNA processing protein, putative [Neospora caninum Liverpool]|eukprot:XP_003884357.1 putative rRNA processing protein [Neospora caninum Liverpool]